MKKRNFMYLFLTFIILFSFNLKSAFAEIGDRNTPYSAWFNYNFTLQEYEWDKPKEVELQLFDMYTGDEANEIVANENMFNSEPADDEEWIVMGFNLKYVSGPEEPLSASDVVNSYNSFYTKSGQKVNPIETASFGDQLDGLSEYDVELYPGAESEVYYGILVKKTVGYPIIRIGMGYDSRADQTIYGWFSTDPDYVEPILSPTNVKVSASTYNSAKLSWTKADDVSGYDIYRSTSSTGTYTKIATTSSTSYTNSSLNTGTTYYYKIKSYKKGTSTQYSDYSKIVSVKPALSTPTSVKATSSSYNSVKTSWSAVSGASGYEVYRSTSSNGTYSRVGTITSTSYTNSSLTTNKTYYYKVKSYRVVSGKKVYGNYSSVVSAKPIPSVPTNFNATKVSSTSSKVSWSSVSGASGYEIYRSTSITGSYSLVKSTTSTSYTNSSLTKKKTYYYKVRTYRTVGSTKVYSGWTSIKSVKL
ncbi:fibronectin type III domain-containing protein [Gottfriedia sp. NPDC056225]|uniref:fibronectin type III domain-containing protein n=1 Tax=Gottfriedia sp. NPDC056225 TaxID=3345751 RepID=UPI0035E1BF35